MQPSEKIGLYSLLTNSFLVILKASLAFLSGSLGLAADAVHSFTDVISSATVVAGIRISRRKSKNFPYGLYKVENLVSLISSIFIFIAGYEIIHMVFYRTASINPKYLPYALAGIILCMVITFFFSRYELKRGKDLGSPALVADARHIQTDLLSSLVILAGVTGSFFGFQLDKIAAAIVAIFVFRSGTQIFIDALRVLLDASLDFDTMDRVKTIILKDPDVVAINSLRGRNSGPFKFIEADIVIKARTLDKAHLSSQRIEAAIKTQIPHVDQVLIHYEPRKKEAFVYAVPLNEDKTVIADHFGDAPFFYIITVRRGDGAILEEAFYKNPVRSGEKGKGIKVSKWLVEKGIDGIFSPKSFEGKGPGYVFSDAGVEVIIANLKGLEDIKKRIQQKARQNEE